SVVLLDLAVRDLGLRQRELFGHRIKARVVFFGIARQMVQSDRLLRSSQRSPKAEDRFATSDLKYRLAPKVKIAKYLVAGPGIVEVLIPQAQGVSQPTNALLLAGGGFAGYDLIRGGHRSGLQRVTGLRGDLSRGILTRPPRRLAAVRGRRMQVPCQNGK